MIRPDTDTVPGLSVCSKESFFALSYHYGLIIPTAHRLLQFYFLCYTCEKLLYLSKIVFFLQSMLYY